jgi:hypothetical protein
MGLTMEQRRPVTKEMTPKVNRPTKKKRKRSRTYGKEIHVALQKAWVICDGICGKRLAPYLAETVPTLEWLGGLAFDEETRRKLIGISPATIDRMLAPARKRHRLRARSQTKPRTLLKHQIPTRTFGDWDNPCPGLIAVDLVSHEGGNARGDYAYTLDATDAWSGWTETEAGRDRAERWVFAGLEKVKERFPFEITGIDSDNGSKFIDNHLFRYFVETKLTFTRSRPYRKKDDRFEQKNDSGTAEPPGSFPAGSPRCQALCATVPPVTIRLGARSPSHRRCRNVERSAAFATTRGFR